MNASSGVNSKRGRKPGRNSNKNGDHKGDMKAKLGKNSCLTLFRREYCNTIDHTSSVVKLEFHFLFSLIRCLPTCIFAVGA